MRFLTIQLSIMVLVSCALFSTSVNGEDDAVAAATPDIQVLSGKRGGWGEEKENSYGEFAERSYNEEREKRERYSREREHSREEREREHRERQEEEREREYRERQEEEREREQRERESSQEERESYGNEEKEEKGHEEEEEKGHEEEEEKGHEEEEEKGHEEEEASEKVKTCPKIPYIKHGKVVVIDSVAFYTCDYKYNIKFDGVVNAGHRQAFRICDYKTYKWQGKTPTCEERTCPPLTSPANGFVKVSNTKVNGVAKYFCKYGYKLIGDSSRKCTYKYSWSGRTPVCKKFHHGEKKAGGKH